MDIQISVAAPERHVAHTGLLGENIEAYENTIPAMLSDRVRNTKFCGPENHQTGLAPEWEPGGNNMAGFMAKLVPGMFLSGTESQFVRNLMEGGWCEILQTGIQLWAGEEVEVELWARALHRPAGMYVHLRPPYGNQTPYATANLEVTRAHWSCYRVRMACPADQANATLALGVAGGSAVYIDQIHLRPVGATHVNRSFLDRMAERPCTSLRFPGGCMSCTYHWRNGIGPVHLRAVHDDPVFKYRMHYDFGTDEYLELCDANGIRPYITVNTTSDTADSAAEWAAYVRNWFVSRAKPVPAAYFMFGNENYSFHEQGHLTPEMYVSQLAEFVPPVRQAYPEARIIAMGRTDFIPLHPPYGQLWRAKVLPGAAEHFDLLAVGSYGVMNPAGTLGEGLSTLRMRVDEFEGIVDAAVADIRASGLDRKVGIYEWNVWSCAAHSDKRGFYEPNDIRHCCYIAGAMGMLCRHADMVEVANHYSLVNTMGTMQVQGGRAAWTDIARVFALYAEALPGTVLDVPLPEGAAKDFTATWLRKGRDTHGILVNWSDRESVIVHLEGMAIRNALVLSASGVEQPVVQGVPAHGDHVVTVPPASIVRIIGQ